MYEGADRAAAAKTARRARFPSDAPSDREEVYVYPGQVVASPDPVLASTILGICVSVCLFDPSLRLGGMNHFMLPSAPHRGPASERFGDVATSRLAEALAGLGAKRGRLQAKVFGGMAGRITDAGLAGGIGARNIAMALDSLVQLRIPVVAQDVGGPKSRKLLFDTADGRAWVRYF